MGARPVRTLRALASALVATFVAAAFHVVGGGSNPGAVTIGLTLAAAALACLALSAARMTMWRLVLSVVASQTAFHVLFQITGSASTLAGHDHVASDVAHTGQAMHDAGGMTLAHVIAATLTIAVLATGERSLRAVLHIVRRFVLRAIDQSPLVPIAGPDTATPRAESTTIRVHLRRVAAHPALRRGPPSFA